MQAAALITSLALAGGVSAADLRGARNGARGLVAAGMRPEVVAESFADVEDEWRSQAQEFAECRAPTNSTGVRDCSAPAAAFGKSCSVVAKSMVDGSSGDGAVVTEYMSYVCNSSALVGWKQEGCYNFARAMGATMTDDKYNNRENLNITDLCGRYWEKFSAEEEKRVEKEREIAEKERAEREAEEKKRAEEAAEAAKKAAEEAAKAEAERQKAEQAKKAEEARQQAEEAKLKAEEAARSLEAKKQEAEKLAAEANRTKEEARIAADAHAHLANRTNGTLGSNETNTSSTGAATTATSNATRNSTSK